MFEWLWVFAGVIIGMIGLGSFEALTNVRFNFVTKLYCGFIGGLTAYTIMFGF